MGSGDDIGICGISGIDARSCKKRSRYYFGTHGICLLTLRLNAELRLNRGIYDEIKYA